MYERVKKITLVVFQQGSGFFLSYIRTITERQQDNNNN